MGILDDAIREHLDLKRRHGARDSELREIEDDAFGSGDRPDPFAAGELFGETATPGQGEPGSDEVSAPETPAPAGLGEEPMDEEPTRLVEPEASAPAPPAEIEQELPRPPEPQEPQPEESESLGELMAEDGVEAPERTDPAIPAPPESSEPAQEAPPESEEPEPEPIPEPVPEPESSQSVPDPPPPPPEPGTEPPGRARGRVHHATEEHPAPDLDEEAGPPSGEPLEPAGPPSGGPLEPEGASSDQPAEPGSAREPELYDFETDEAALGSSEPPAPPPDDFEELGPPAEGVADPEEEEPYTEEGETRAADPGQTDDDLLSESPKFMEGEPEEEEEEEGEDLWFEKGPPKDFDFEDE